MSQGEARTPETLATFDKVRFEQAPCYICGYNGQGYYQPGIHRCAAMYHGYELPTEVVSSNGISLLDEARQFVAECHKGHSLVKQLLAAIEDQYAEIQRLRSERDQALVRMTRYGLALERWSSDGRLQTFEDRQRFRAEVRALSEEPGFPSETPSAPASNPIGCGHLRVYHSNFGRWDERQGSCLFCEIERLRAALLSVQNRAKDLNDAIGIANNALYGEPGSAVETTAKPTDSELYSSSELFRHIWVCPMGWIGDKLVYGPGYTSADMKPWLVKLRRLVGFEHPEGTPLEQPEKASDEPG